MIEINTRALKVLAKLYQEIDSTFYSEGVEYDLNKIFRLVEDKKIKYVKIENIEWSVDFDQLDRERIERADIDIPIITVPYEHRKHLVVDGAHRVAKAKILGYDIIPAKTLTKKEFEQAALDLESLRLVTF